MSGGTTVVALLTVRLNSCGRVRLRVTVTAQLTEALHVACPDRRVGAHSRRANAIPARIVRKGPAEPDRVGTMGSYRETGRRYAVVARAALKRVTDWSACS